MIWLQLLYVYLKIGILGFGGGYAMLSLIQADVVDRYGWISLQEFTAIGAISQMTPGPIGINLAMLRDPKAYADNVSACSLCLSCSNVCPAKVDLASRSTSGDSRPKALARPTRRRRCWRAAGRC